MKHTTLLTGLFVLSLAAQAQTPNTLRDTTFVLDVSGAGALVFSPNEFPYTQVLPLSDGKVLLFGSFGNPLQTVISGVVRLNNDGSWDDTFDGPDFDQDYYLKVRAAVELPDGKYLVGGQFQDFSNGVNQLGIIRLNSDGSQDLSFNAGFGFNPTINAIALRPDGKIMIAGSYSSVSHGTGITRLNPDGTVDATFNAGNAPTSVSDIKVLPNGQLLVSGFFPSWPGGSTQEGVAVLNADGTLDPTFTHAGEFGALPFTAPRTAVQPDGKIIVAGLDPTSSSKVKVVRYNADYSLDTDFHVANNDPISGVFPTGVAVQNDGRILVSGYFLNEYDGVNTVSGILRLNTDGTVDATFDTNNGFGSGPLVYHCALQADGGVLVVHQNSSYQGQSLTLGAGFPTVQYLVRLNGDATGTAIAEVQEPFTLEVHPNPARDVLYLAGAPLGAVVRLTDASGRLLREQQVTGPRQSLAIGELAPGLYLLAAHHAGGRVTRRVVVER